MIVGSTSASQMSRLTQESNSYVLLSKLTIHTLSVQTVGRELSQNSQSTALLSKHEILLKINFLNVQDMYFHF